MHHAKAARLTRNGLSRLTNFNVSLTNLPTAFVKGIDRSIAPLLADRASFYTLRNLRQSFEQRGLIEQTPYWYATQFNAGTYYNAGSQTEPSTSAVRLVAPDLLVTDYVCRGPSGQLQVFYQACDNSTETDIHFGCRVVINDLSALAITLGSTLEIDIDAATTFRWRKNGGAYTSGVAITTTGVDIDGGNATVYFLVATGHTVGTTWTWTRTDASFADATGTFEYPLEYTYYKGDLYFNSVDDRMMMMTEDDDGDAYVISVGYRPVVGSYFTFFDDHLVLTWFRRGTTGWTGTERHDVIGWSDKNDIHNFIPTDVNEADEYKLPNLSKLDDVDAADSYLMGVVVMNNTCYAFTNNEVYLSPALGLPLVFSWQKLMDTKLTGTYSSVVKAEQGAYVIGYDDVFFFDGASMRSVGAAVIQGTDNNNFEGSFGAWDFVRQELNIVLGTLLFVYQQKWDTWYVREVDFSNNDEPVTAIAAYSDVVLGGVSRKRFQEDTIGAQVPAFDSTNGTVFAEPYLITQAFGKDLATVKSMSAAYLGATVDATGVLTANYTTSTGVVFQLSYWVMNNGALINVSEVIPTGATYATSNSDGTISFPPFSFRAVAMALEVQGTAAKPPYKAYITQLVPIVANAEEAKVVK